MLKQMALGIGLITIEIVKTTGEAGVDPLWRIDRVVLKGGIVPIERRQLIIVPLWKRS